MIELSNYIRNIAVFLIFTSFIKIISPGGKYDKYINLILGIILIFMIATPIFSIIGWISGGGTLPDLSVQQDRAALVRQIEDSDAAGQEMILDAYREGLAARLRHIVDGHGEFVLVESLFEIDREENFGDIKSLHMIVDKIGGSMPFISIDRVRIDFGVNTRGQPQEDGDAEPWQIMSLKNLISDFYNLDMQNIVIETRN